MYLSMPLFRSPDPSDLDAELLDRLLAGRVDPDDAPQAYKGVARVLAAATTPPTASEHADEERAVRQFSQEASGGEPVRTVRGGRLARPLVAAVASVAILAGAGVAAAAGALPTPAQRLAHAVLADIGIDTPVPAASGAHPATTTTHATSTTARASTTTVCTLKQGRCQDNHGTAVCTVASDGKCRDNHGLTVCTIASNGKCVHVSSPPTHPAHPVHPTHPAQPTHPTHPPQTSVPTTSTTAHGKSGNAPGKEKP
jgi:hypothetical protein